MNEESVTRLHGTVIGIVEDDCAHAALLDAILAQAGITPLVYHSVRDFRRRNGINSVDLILLDWNMPHESGMALLESLREHDNRSIPVIFVTGNERESEVVQALHAGADDYLIKPVSSAELIARIQSVMRRSGAVIREFEDFTPFEFHSTRRILKINGRIVSATPKEFDLMLFLFRRAERTVGRDAILAHVWQTRTVVPTRTIDTYISRLRSKFGLDGRNGWKIEGVYQQGYRVQRIEGDTRENERAGKESG